MSLVEVPMVTETVELTGHILDSLILPKVLDEILEREGRFEILEMAVGERPADMSRVRLRVEAPAPETLEAILTRLRERGAAEMGAIRARGGKILVVAGPAVVHTGAGPHMVRLIDRGYVNVLFAGNA